MDYKITIKNLPQLRAAFAKAPKFMAEEFTQALKQAGYLVMTKSMKATPVRTGFLRSSHLQRGQGGVFISGSGTHTRAEVGPTADYSYFVHEGTRFMRARPFLKNALFSSDNEIQQLFTKATQNALNKVARLV